ncbi:hypothetical protein RV134_250155 [Roseovarius sp. EC-HK134]|nr:hypothetical protein RV134_250155 [Roseovarius sp. EC-HK134]
MKSSKWETPNVQGPRNFNRYHLHRYAGPARLDIGGSITLLTVERRAFKCLSEKA